MPLGRFRFNTQKSGTESLTNAQRPGLFSSFNPLLLPQRMQGFLPGAGDGVQPAMPPGLERFLSRRGFVPGPLQGGLAQPPALESGPQKKGIKDLLGHFGFGKKQ